MKFKAGDTIEYNRNKMRFKILKINESKIYSIELIELEDKFKTWERKDFIYKYFTLVEREDEKRYEITWV